MQNVKIVTEALPASKLSVNEMLRELPIGIGEVINK